VNIDKDADADADADVVVCAATHCWRLELLLESTSMYLRCKGDG